MPICPAVFVMCVSKAGVLKQCGTISHTRTEDNAALLVLPVPFWQYGLTAK